MTKEQIRERRTQRRRESREAAAWLYEIISDNLGQLHNNRTLKPSAMRIVDLQGFRILFKRLSKMAPHVNRYFHTKLGKAREQRYAALNPKLKSEDVYAQLAKLGLTLSLNGNGAKPKPQPKECKHGVFMYSAGVLYCAKCGSVAQGKAPVALAPFNATKALPDYEVVQGAPYGEIS